MTEKRKKINWLSWARDLGIVFLLVLIFQWWQTRDIALGSAPLLGGPMLSGKSASLSDYKGKVVLVHFWATWCPVCRIEEGTIERLSKDYPVLSVAITSGGRAEVSDYLHGRGLNFPVMLDDSGALGESWGIKGVPSSFVVDARGEIRSVAVGYTSELGLRFRLWLAGS